MPGYNLPDDVDITNDEFNGDDYDWDDDDYDPDEDDWDEVWDED